MTTLRCIELTVNGTVHALTVNPTVSLLQVLRHDLGLSGPKYGCGLGQCGACLVLLDGKAARSCVLPVAAATALHITTLEGLARDGILHQVQQAFIAKQGAQCGYCLNGMIMRTVALLEHFPSPSEGDIRQALKWNLCRCGAHEEILQSVRDAIARTARPSAAQPDAAQPDAAQPGAQQAG
jgi:nicotinate dehydrogenase subunit A